jgi:nicotinamidase-related amidase
MDRLEPHSTLVFVVDVQDKLASAMPPETFATVVKNIGILLDAAQALGVRVLATEQYPKGLGATVAPIAERLRQLSVAPFAKDTFDACSDLAVARALADLAPRAVIVVGMEAHVCVFQTARELVKRGYATYVVADAVSSRTEENRRYGLALSERAGALVTVTETAVFDLLGRAGTDAFRAVSKLIR